MPHAAHQGICWQHHLTGIRERLVKGRINCTPEKGNKACCQAIQNYHNCCNYVCCPHQDAHHPEDCANVLLRQTQSLNLLHKPDASTEMAVCTVNELV